MRLGFDVDGVFADFARGFAKLFPDRRIPVELSSFPPMWDWPQYYGASEQEITRAWTEVRTSERFWLDLTSCWETPYPLHRICGLLLDHDIYFITCRHGRQAKRQTEEWLSLNGISTPTVLIASEFVQKALLVAGLELHAYIDDKRSTLDSCVAQSSVTKYFLLDRPWNRYRHTAGGWLTRVTSVNQMLDQIGV